MALRAAVATSPADAKANYDDFEWMKVLGKGASGKVMLARHKPTNLIYAVKVIRKDDVMQVCICVMNDNVLERSIFVYTYGMGHTEACPASIFG